MYDITKRKKLNNLNVGELINELKNLPRGANVVFCGDSIGYIHVERDGSVVCIDTEDLDGDYEEDPDTSPEDFWRNRESMQ